MDFISEFLTPEVLAIIIVSTGVIVIIAAVFISNKIAAVSLMFDDFRSEFVNRVQREIGGIADTIPKEVGKVSGVIQNELSSLSDASRDSLQKTVSEVNKEVNDFKNEFSSAAATRHGELQKDVAEINERIMAFAKQTSKDIEVFKTEQIKADAERHEALQKKFTEQALHLQDRIHNLGKDNADSFDKMQERIRKTVATGLNETGSHVTDRLSALSHDVHKALESMVGMVGTRLNERFEKTNESMQSLTARLTAIDAAQKNIQSLSADVVNLTRVMADKRARGAFGTVQLAHLVKDVLPREHYEFDVELPCGTAAPLLLKLPDPTGNIAVTADLSLDNFSRIHDIDGDPDGARAAFEDDLKSAMAVAKDCIDPPFTNSALLFVPSESAFAEIHAHFRSLVEEAYRNSVWIVSPTTMMALLNMAASTIKDVAMRKEAMRIREELQKFGEDFRRFTRLVESLADNIGQANKDIVKAQSEGQLITDRLAALGHADEIKAIGSRQSSND